MIWGSTPAAVAARFAAVAQRFVADGPAERSERGRRGLLAAVAANEPATLKDVAGAVGRGAPAVSRSLDVLVRAGLVERTADPDNRRRLAMRLTERGREVINSPMAAGAQFSRLLERLAPSELRAIERALEILDR